MIDKVLTNLIYLFYPQNICSYTQKEEYFATEEYNRLKEIIVDFDSEKSKILRTSIIDSFGKDITLKNFKDLSLFEWEDRCFTFNLNIIEDGELYTISLYVSVLIPYYVIKVQKGMIELWFSKSQIEELEKENKETRKVNGLILDIETIIENKFFYKKFPEELGNIIIPNVSFQDSTFGHFNMFNAFFNNVIIKDDEN
nr:hypothetical protein [uncultured Flavobacterium sp.]